MADLVSAITWKSSKSYDEVLDFTIYRLYDALNQINTVDNYTFTMNGIYAGTIDKWDENTSEDVVAESFLDYWWNTDHPCRRCSVCGKLMDEGYCEDMGAAYYCSDECLHTEYTDEEWAEECESNDQSYVS